MFVMCPPVHNYSVITLDTCNWYLAYCGLTLSNDHKLLAMNVCLYSN